MNITDIPVIDPVPLFSSDNLFLMNILKLTIIILIFHLTLSTIALLMHLYLYATTLRYSKKFSHPDLNFTLERKLWPTLNFLFKFKITINNEIYYLQHESSSLTSLEKIFYQKKFLLSLKNQHYLGLGEISLFLNKFRLKNFTHNDLHSYTLYSPLTKRHEPLTLLVEKNKP